MLKGYPRLKMETSQNVVFKTLFKNSFISWKSHIPFLRNSIFYALHYSMSFESYVIMLSTSRRGKVHLNKKLVKLIDIDIVMDNILRKKFTQLAGLGSKSKGFSITTLPQLIQNQLCWAYGVLLFWRWTLRRSKIVSIIYKKSTGCNKLPFYQNHPSLKLVSSFQISSKSELEMFVISCTDIWPRFILILPKILEKPWKL